MAYGYRVNKFIKILEEVKNMIASIFLTGKYNVGIGDGQKVLIEGHTLSLKQIPFVRYSFDSYGEEEIEFIRGNQQKFVGPVHMAQVTLSPTCRKEIEDLKKLHNLAVFLYIPVYDQYITNGIPEDVKLMLEGLYGAEIDRVMIKDKTSMLYPVAAERLKSEICEAMDHGVSRYDIGICGSPLSFRNNDAEGQACLTALWARRIMADYAESDDIVVPSASQECMTHCGCLQYFIIDKDIPAPVSKREAAKIEEVQNTSDDGSDTAEKAEKKEKVAKVPKAKGIALWDLDI